MAKRNARAARTASLMGLVVLGLAQIVFARGGGKGSQAAAKDFQYELSDCLEEERQDSVGLIVSDDSVQFNQVFTMNCIAATRPSTVKVLYAKKGRALEISVVLRSPVLSDCTCPIAIGGRIANLGKGTYRLSFVYDAQVGDSLKPTRQSLGTKEFRVP